MLSLSLNHRYGCTTKHISTQVEICNKVYSFQGVNLANIVTSSDGDSDQHIVETALKCLGLDEKLPEEKVVEYCSTVKSECSKGLAEKMLATKHDGYNILVKIALKEDQKKASLEAVKVDSDFSA